MSTKKFSGLFSDMNNVFKDMGSVFEDMGDAFKDMGKSFQYNDFPQKSNIVAEESDSDEFSYIKYNIKEHNDNNPYIDISFDVPGVSPENIKAWIPPDRDYLCVSTVRGNETKSVTLKLYGSYDLTKISANLKHGVLYVKIPKKEINDNSNFYIKIFSD